MPVNNFFNGISRVKILNFWQAASSFLGGVCNGFCPKDGGKIFGVYSASGMAGVDPNMGKPPYASILSRLGIFFIVLGALANSSCNGLRVYVSNTIPPDFTFNVGSFAECCRDFHAFAVLEENVKDPLWRIVSERSVQAVEANRMVIHYGKVPKGFEQEIPTSEEPPQLVEGKTYLAVAEASYVPWASIRFMVRDNRIVSLPPRRY